jgi:hypothetical protein
MKILTVFLSCLCMRPKASGHLRSMRRRTLRKLPNEVAHAVAQGNAERLWKLSAAVTGQGCGALKR